MKKIKLVNRLWGFSIGLFWGTFWNPAAPLWFKVVTGIACGYFMTFGDTHLVKEDTQDEKGK